MGKIWLPKYLNVLLIGIEEDTNAVLADADKGMNTDFSQLIL